MSPSIYTFLLLKVVIASDIKPVCSDEMFNGSQEAVQACQTVDALMYNWYPSPLEGFNSYQVWNGFDGFWQDGSALETLVNFDFYTNTTRYSKTIFSAHRNLTALIDAYGPEPSFDDMAWYGMAFARVAEVYPNKNEFFETSNEIYEWIWENGWDHFTYNATC